MGRPRRFRTIYADPAWNYDDKCHAGRRGAEYVYPCMSDEDVMGLPVQEIAADESTLFLWATWPKLTVALDVIACWGFEYSTIGFIWVKTAKHQPRSDTYQPPRLHWGMGHWTRANSEPCLFARRGRPKALSHSIHSVVHAPVGLHSAKPSEVRERIQTLTPAPRAELFLRGPVSPGWWGWGNQAEGPRTFEMRA